MLLPFSLEALLIHTPYLIPCSFSVEQSPGSKCSVCCCQRVFFPMIRALNLSLLHPMRCFWPVLCGSPTFQSMPGSSQPGDISSLDESTFPSPPPWHGSWGKLQVPVETLGTPLVPGIQLERVRGGCMCFCHLLKMGCGAYLPSSDFLIIQRWNSFGRDMSLVPHHPYKEPISSPHWFDWNQFTQAVSPWLSVHPLAFLWELFSKCTGLLISAGEVRHRKHPVPPCSAHMLNLLLYFQSCACWDNNRTFSCYPWYSFVSFHSFQVWTALELCHFSQLTVFPNSSFCSCHFFYLLCFLFPLELCPGSLHSQAALLTHLCFPGC